MISPIKALIFNFAMIFGVVVNRAAVEQKFDPYNMDPAYRVPKVSTPVDQKQIAHILCRTHVSEFGRTPKASSLALSWAQVALENNRGKKVWNNNLGNQGPFRMDQEYYHHLRGGWPYRSFRTVDQSGESYWRIIKRCTMALHAFDFGDPRAAAAALKRCNYYTSDEEGYARVLTSLYHEARSRVTNDVDCSDR
jgi:hypothetical protein